jgi:uncharacterized membrane protein YdbT with pleckstrin-like domain
MGLATNTDRVPARINKYLLPYESRVITVHQHPAVLLRPFLFLLAGLVLAVLVNIGVHTRDVIIAVWILFAILLAWVIGKIIERAVTYFVVTTKRMVLAEGVFVRKVNMLPLTKVTEMTFQQSPFGQLLGYGEFLVESAGPEQALSHITYLPYPEQLYLEVCGLIFKDEDENAY